jgi:hypothetical protein
MRERRQVMERDEAGMLSAALVESLAIQKLRCKMA